MKERAQPTTDTTESVRRKREVAHIPGLSPAEMALLAFLPEDERELFMAAMVSTTPAPVTTTDQPGLRDSLSHQIFGNYNPQASNNILGL